MAAQPLFQHHRDPDHFTEVSRMLVKVFVQELVDEVCAQNPPVDQSSDGFRGNLFQAFVLGGPHAERQTKALFLFGENFIREEAAQCFLEEPA